MTESSHKRVLFVLTGNDRLGDTGKPTGYHLAEVAHPWRVLSDAGVDIDFATPGGVSAPMDPGSHDTDDPDNRALLEDPDAARGLETPRAVEDVDTERYDAIYFPGGHGTMWDLADNRAVAGITARMYEKGGLVAAVCHGPAALVNVRLSDDAYLVAGRTVAAFTDAEEAAVGLDTTVPFLLASRLVEQGARHQKADDFAANVAVDGRLITGQNPASARGVGEALRDSLAREPVRHTA